MHILCVSPDIAPYGASPAAKVSSGLSHALRHLNHDVTLLSPLHPSINAKALSLARRLDSIHVTLGQHIREFHIYDGRSASGVTTVFLDNRSLFERPYDPKDDSNEDCILRMLVFASAAAQWLNERKEHFDLVHWHDWPMALGAVISKHRTASLPTLYSVYDLQHQGRLPEIMLSALGLSQQGYSGDLIYGGSLNLVAAAVRSSDRVLTMGASQATSLLSEPFAHGLSRIFKERLSPPLGIPYGIDGGVWDPSKDRLIAFPYDVSDLSGKVRCKTAIQSLYALPLRTEVPLLVALMPSLEASKPSFVEVLIALLRNDVQILLMQSLEVQAPYVDSLRDKFPDRFAQAPMDTEQKVHQILAGGDLFLVPPDMEDPALTLAAMRYGAAPIAPSTLPLGGDIVDCDVRMETGTGFVYDETAAAALLATCQRALGAFADPVGFRHLQARLMKSDYSWNRVARYYDQIAQEVTTTPG